MVKLPIGTHDVGRPGQVSRRDACLVLSVNSLHVGMVLSGQDFDEAASDCSRRCNSPMFAANARDQISADDRDIRYEWNVPSVLQSH